MMMYKYFVLYCREEQSLVEKEHREEIEEPTIEDPGKNSLTLLMPFVIINIYIFFLFTELSKDDLIG